MRDDLYGVVVRNFFWAAIITRKNIEGRGLGCAPDITFDSRENVDQGSKTRIAPNDCLKLGIGG